jgi:aspartate/methionine/tyrosine aminotransferase
MKRPARFALEDFFDEYEHRRDLINLASSDSEPWSAEELDLGPDGLVDRRFIEHGYPNPKELLIPALENAFGAQGKGSALPTAGASEAIAIVMHSLSVDDNCKTVGLPAPAYGAFRGWAQILGLKVEFYSYAPERNWVPDINEINKLAKQCDALVVINPHNPTGAVISRDTLLEQAEVLASRHGVLVVDEVFAADPKAESLAYASDNVIVIGSLSKMYGLPGLRLGWILADRARLKAMRTIQQYTTLSLPAFTTSVAPKVINQLPTFARSSLVSGNRALLREWANCHAEIVSISPPCGGTTVIIDIHRPGSEDDLFQSLIDHGILLAPGRCFELSGQTVRFRMGYGMRKEVLKRGLDKLVESLSC